jgi:hypothetical protein
MKAQRWTFALESPWVPLDPRNARPEDGVGWSETCPSWMTASVIVDPGVPLREARVEGVLLRIRAQCVVGDWVVVSSKIA